MGRVPRPPHQGFRTDCDGDPRPKPLEPTVIQTNLAKDTEEELIRESQS